MSWGRLVAAGALASMLISGTALAQATAPATPAAPAATPAAPMAADAMDAKAVSKACSADADKQGLKGKSRKAFRAKCKRDKMKAM